jgi:proline dehydrogenase
MFAQRWTKLSVTSLSHIKFLCPSQSPSSYSSVARSLSTLTTSSSRTLHAPAVAALKTPTIHSHPFSSSPSPNPTPPSSSTVIDFQNTKSIFESKSFSELIRGYVVFKTCEFPFLVSNAQTLITTSYKYLGKSLTDFVLKLSFFSHFCAGETTEGIKPVIHQFDKNGIGSILDYAAEADFEELPELSIEEKKIQVRTYDYMNEALCDKRTEVFAKCLRSAHEVKGNRSNAFVAIKCTALTDPKLLEKMSIAVRELRNLFNRFDSDNSGYITLDEFKQQYEAIFTNSSNFDEIFQQLDTDKDGKVDYVGWSNIITIEDLRNVTQNCRVKGPLFNATFTDEERDMLLKMRSRVNYLAELASDMNVQMMIDAEHTYFQPAIDNIAYTLMNRYNKNKAVIFTTYQMYLNDSMSRLLTDLHRAHEGNYYFSTKIVRGAYLELEQKRAEEMGYPNPIQPNKEATDENYNNAIKELLLRMKNGSKVELMVASHNQNSIETTVNLMKEFSIPASGSVHFAQLMGMADHLTYGLGHNGYKAYKYVPYGLVEEVMPYLTRRAQENSGMLGGAKNELMMLRKEIKRRLFGIDGK